VSWLNLVCQGGRLTHRGWQVIRHDAGKQGTEDKYRLCATSPLFVNVEQSHRRSAMGKVSENRHWMTGRQVVTGGVVSALTSQAAWIYCRCDGVQHFTTQMLC